MTYAQQFQLRKLGWTSAHFQPAVRDGLNRASTYNRELKTAAIVNTPEGKPEAFQRLFEQAVAISRSVPK